MESSCSLSVALKVQSACHMCLFIVGVPSTSWLGGGGGGGGLGNGKDKMMVEYAKHVRKPAKLGAWGHEKN